MQASCNQPFRSHLFKNQNLGILYLSDFSQTNYVWDWIPSTESKITIALSKTFNDRST